MQINFWNKVILYATAAGLTAYQTITGPIDGHAIASIVLAIVIAVQAKLSPGATADTQEAVTTTSTVGVSDIHFSADTPSVVTNSQVADSKGSA